MANKIVVGAALVAVGAAAGALVASRPAVVEPTVRPEGYSDAAAAPAPGFGAVRARHPPAADPNGLAQAIEHLATQLTEETAARRQLEARLDAVAAQLAARADGPAADATALPADATADPAAPVQPLVGPGSSAMEKALVAAGVDPAAAVDLKRRDDDLAMAEMYLRDQATREGWVDTPRFATEMAAIQQQRVAVRDAVGDDAYDRYLFVLGATNRVRVDDVMLDSPAALAGVQTGDLVLRYDGARLFNPSELIAQTRSGRAGEIVRIELKRGGQIVDVEIPRGPLGLRVNAGRDSPT